MSDEEKDESVGERAKKEQDEKYNSYQEDNDLRDLKIRLNKYDDYVKWDAGFIYPHRNIPI